MRASIACRAASANSSICSAVAEPSLASAPAHQHRPALSNPYSASARRATQALRYAVQTNV